mgnify:FL=1
MFAIRYKTPIFIITALYIVAALLAFFVWGLKPGIDFTGGSLFELSFPNGRPEKVLIEETVKKIVSGDSLILPVGENKVHIRTAYLEGRERSALVSALSGEYGAVEDGFSSVGPVIGEELKQKAILALSLVVVVIILFIAFAFRKVSEPVSSWVYGLIAIITLAHDILVPIGLFAFLGKFAHVQVDILFVTALLTIWGYSVTDTIVVFDRIRENLRVNKEKGGRISFADIVGKSLEETYARSLTTSLMTLIVLVSLYIIGGEVTRNFALALIVGIIAGSASSIFLAAPLLVVWNDWRSKKTSK